jgi:hypothetical protein
MRMLLVAVLACIAATVPAPSATAASRIQYGIQDDAWLAYGPGTLAQRVATLDGMGFDVVRVTLVWRQLEPEQGTFRWTQADRILRALNARGLAPVVTLWGTPEWANGGFGPNIAPTRASDMSAFAREVALRYPFVRYWVAWNEPNKPTWLKPASPETYVTRILDPLYRGIKSVAPADRVAGGVTAPRGGKSGLSALAFLRRMASAHARLDAYAHNPYPLFPGETPKADECACPALTMANLNRLILEVGRAFPRARIWLTEYGYQTRPPDPYGVSLADQARFVGEAAHRAYIAPKVDMLIHYLYRDEPDLARWQSGLETVTGKIKPARAASILPLALVVRRGTRTTLWGQVRPGSGPQRYAIEMREGAVWRRVGGLRTTSARGYFTVTITAARGTKVRLVYPRGGVTGPPLSIR